MSEFTQSELNKINEMQQSDAQNKQQEMNNIMLNLELGTRQENLWKFILGNIKTVVETDVLINGSTSQVVKDTANSVISNYLQLLNQKEA